MADAVDRLYLQSVLDEDPPPAAPAPGAGPLLAGAPPLGPFALHGTVLTPDTAMNSGYVVVDGGTIREVRTTKPTGLPIVRTEGVILPGLIDLHGHPEFNIFAAWEPPRLFLNRGAWRRSDEYAALVREPMNQLTDQPPSLSRTLLRYAEARALTGGTTAIQGVNGSIKLLEEPLVRNVDRLIFGEHRARSIVDLDREMPDRKARLRGQIATGELDAVYIHLAEGVNDTSRREFDQLVSDGLLTSATVIIHGTALTPAQWDDVAAAGAKLVWSPQSNLRLYGDTTLAAEARARDIPVALGADWLPSGSPSLLAEMKVARQVLADQGRPATARQLVRMVTRDAARIAGLEASLGLLAADRPADVLVLARRNDDPWESVLVSTPADVELVTIGGDLAYGRTDWVTKLAASIDGTEPVIAWGKRMLVDTRYSVRETGTPAPKLAELRAELIARYPQVGPIFG